MRLTGLTLIITLLFNIGPAALPAMAAAAKARQEATDWRRVANAIPLGSKVKVQTTNGDRVTGTLMRVDDTTVIVKKDTRRPEPATTIPLDQVARIERAKEGGFSVAKAIAIGAGAGAAAMVTLILFALQFD